MYGPITNRRYRGRWEFLGIKKFLGICTVLVLGRGKRQSTVRGSRRALAPLLWGNSEICRIEPLISRSMINARIYRQNLQFFTETTHNVTTLASSHNALVTHARKFRNQIACCYFLKKRKTHISDILTAANFVSAVYRLVYCTARTRAGKHPVRFAWFFCVLFS